MSTFSKLRLLLHYESGTVFSRNVAAAGFKPWNFGSRDNSSTTVLPPLVGESKLGSLGNFQTLIKPFQLRSAHWLPVSDFSWHRNSLFFNFIFIFENHNIFFFFKFLTLIFKLTKTIQKHQCIGPARFEDVSVKRYSLFRAALYRHE